ncbi:hypothetical protein [Microbulbifer sp. HZ11]|uniref:hypothetical protein n=1 Tax=Microbulbifer sp. HZ11 TaxID=1453501 RepID=UPI0005B82088|nr:hypothetical protein [Microbulbifer sp. HZ11]
MSNQRIKIPRKSDKKVWAVFKELASQYSVSKINVNALGFASIGVVNPDSSTAEMDALLSKNSSIIDSMSLPIPGYSVSYHRGGSYPPEQKSGVFDEILLSQSNQNQVSVEDKINIVAFLNKRLNSFDSSKSIKGDPEAQAQLEAMHISTLERLEMLNEELIQKSSEFREGLEKKFSEKQNTLEQKIQKEKERLEGEYRAKNEILETRADDLEKKIKAIDDRNNTHVRRSLRKELQEIIQSRSTEFKLTSGTNKLRTPIHILCIVLIALFASGGIWYALELFNYLGEEGATTINVVILAIKQLGLTIGGVGTAVFYMRWLNRWFEQHSQAEFHLKQFQLDVDRASWVVETALEWNTSTGTTIPAVLMESITKSLFEREGEVSAPDMEAGDQLASAILGSASRVKVQTAGGGAELEFEGKKLKKEMA